MKKICNMSLNKLLFFVDVNLSIIFSFFNKIYFYKKFFFCVFENHFQNFFIFIVFFEILTLEINNFKK